MTRVGYHNNHDQQQGGKKPGDAKLGGEHKVQARQKDLGEKETGHTLHSHLGVVSRGSGSIPMSFQLLSSAPKTPQDELYVITTSVACYIITKRLLKTLTFLLGL